MKLFRLSIHAALALSMFAGLLAGCKHKSHEENTVSAYQRWNSVKSNIAIQMAEDQFNAGQLVVARKTIEDAMINDPENPGLWLMGGRIALENSELESAYKRLDKAIEHGEEKQGYPKKEKAKPYYFQGIVDQRWQRYDSAKERYQMAYERDVENVSYFLARVEMMVQLDELDEATRELEEKASYFDQNPTVRGLLGHIYRRQGNHEKAAMWFKQASMLAPEDMKLREEVARSLVAVQRYDEAARTLKELTETEYGKRRADLYRMLAEAYARTDKLREARAVYSDLTAMDRTSVYDWFKLGELAYRLGDDAVALQAANRLINLTPDDHRGYLLAGMVWNRRDRLDRALGMFDKAGELAPRDTTPLIMRGIALQKNDRPAAAADAYRQALEINPDDRRAKQLLTSLTQGLH